MGVFYYDVSVTCALINLVAISRKLICAPNFVIDPFPNESSVFHSSLRGCILT